MNCLHCNEPVTIPLGRANYCAVCGAISYEGSNSCSTPAIHDHVRVIFNACAEIIPTTAATRRVRQLVGLTPVAAEASENYTRQTDAARDILLRRQDACSHVYFEEPMDGAVGRIRVCHLCGRPER